MFCTKCGHQNAQGALFCVSCGNPLANTGNNVQQTSAQQVYPPAAYAIPKKSKTGLIVGICIGGVVLIAAAVVLIILLSGGTSIAGEWYNGELDETIEFYNDGTVEIKTPVTDYEGEFEYNKGSGKGVITIDGDDYDFVVDEDEIEIRNYIYVKDGGDEDKSRGIIGKWFSEELEEGLEFYKNGTIEIVTSYEDYEGEYEYNESRGKGVITINGEDFDFVVDGDEIEIEGYIYIKDGADDSDDLFDFS